MLKIWLALSAAVIFVFLAAPLCSRKESPVKGRSKYSCILDLGIKELRSYEGETCAIHFKIINKGISALSSQGQNPCSLSYHLMDEQGRVLRYENPRFSFPQKIRPGRAIEMTVNIKAPLEKGKYQLEFDLVREGIAWFKDYGSRPAIISLAAEKKEWPEDAYPLGLDAGKYSKISSSQPEFNTLCKLIRITLDKDVVGFAGKTGKVSGFSAGSGYPQVWLRDSNTIIPASRYFYNEDFFGSWIEEHLAFQKQNGALSDWVDSSGRTDKNTTETDQEASAVQAACQSARLLGKGWLQKKILDEPIIDRLEKALNFVLRERYDKKFGLITGAHTADWGDVGMTDATQKAIYLDRNTNWTADIYDQSMFYQACRNLAEMLEDLGFAERAAFWNKIAVSSKENTNKWLWQENKGFYRVHVHLDALRHDFDEDGMFAMGGNAQAILSGIADDPKSRRIIEQAVSRQKSFKISTISGSLLPPYPRGVFKHPMMDDPNEYQNGGQWDWFGGRLVYAMFEKGFSRLAKEKLLEIAKKNIANEGLFEWDSPDGRGLGSDYFAGSAGSLAKALFEGYLGIKISRDSLALEPKLSQDEAKVHLYLPAAGIFVAYEYRASKDQKKLWLSWNSNFPHQGEIKVLLPSEDIATDKKLQGGSKIRVLLDTKNVPFEIVRKNSDIYLLISTNFKKHTLEVGWD